MKPTLFVTLLAVASAASPICNLNGSPVDCSSQSHCTWCASSVGPDMCYGKTEATFFPKYIYTCGATSAAASVHTASARVDDDCDDDDNDICDLHKRDQAGCMANPMCTWCVTSGLVPAEPDCVLTTDAPFIPKQVWVDFVHMHPFFFHKYWDLNLSLPPSFLRFIPAQLKLIPLIGPSLAHRAP
jgi:hypothetical protein